MARSRKVTVFATPPDVACAASSFLCSQIARHTEPRRYAVALSGGNTPILMYRSLTETQGCPALLKEKAEFFFSDERAVSPESDQSNYRTAFRFLFEPLGIQEGRIHRIRGEADDWQSEIERYAQLVRQRLASAGNENPSFDLILLGMGTDGHTASLFPGTDFDTVPDRLIIAPFVTAMGTRRFSFGLSLINAARVVLFLVTGREKAETVRKVLSKQPEACICPAAKVQAERTIWFLDEAAARRLDRKDLEVEEA